MERYTDSQTWYIVFDRSHDRSWWSYLLHPKFAHVYAVRQCGDKSLMVNSFHHVMAIREYDCPITDFMKEAMAATAILQYTVHYGSHYKSAPWEPITCVSVVKRLLGIRSRLVTPKALYHELLRAGAQPVKPWVIV